MPNIIRLATYHFYEDEWASYEELLESFSWEIPETFNMASYICDRWAADEGRVAIFGEDGEGNRETHTFWQLRDHANSVANYLREQGV